MNIKFLGAAMSVTGSCHLVTTDKYKILLDCGMFQGSEAMEELNYQEFAFDPLEIDFMLLSHAHIDHSGRIPLLIKRGFEGRIYCTDATADLADIMLQDSGNIHEREAEWSNRRAQRSGKDTVTPLYNQEDAAACAAQFSPAIYGQVIQINPDITVRFSDAGHILGSSIIELWIREGEEETKLVYSGDLGVKNKQIINDPTIIEEADYLIMEATYGDRVHESNKESVQRLMQIILKTIRRGGNVVIPSFAVGRTQELIYELELFYEKHREHRKELDKIMVYVDSPLATSATEIFRRNAQVFDEETRKRIIEGEDILDFKNLKFTRTIEESKRLNYDRSPKIIISSSGMCDAGRIKHHLKHNLWNPKSSIVFVGYQAEGTLGRSILDGDRHVDIFGEDISVKAEVHSLEGFSAHADKDYLLEWLSGFKKAPRGIFLVHGESEAKQAFAYAVKDELGYDCTVVEDVSEYNLEQGERVGAEDFKSAIENKEQMLKVKGKLANVRNELGAVLKNTSLLLDEKMTKEKLIEISNLALELEKITIKLGTAVADKESQQ
ncbi:ribonuclease (plasmid) [Peptoclostridium acidaminophilum DSM 3953]|uniref:Ribonuclease n=1 Tax=Peptoclostridium acidaminophilum DSM 3953 TaxID=1286171 RepID=W8T7U5_PEPAC|nr:MBL fold metallo-hydrolase [Peptoclostridium acidaminophilum]AHM57804.1 ribonuclease [Peptoclostridium acidaminophilum DSM 3953]